MSEALPIESCLHDDYNSSGLESPTGLSDKGRNEALQAQALALGADASMMADNVITAGSEEYVPYIDTSDMDPAAMVAALAHPPVHRIYQAKAVTPRYRTKANISQILVHTPEGGTSGSLSVLGGVGAGYDYLLPPSGELYKTNDWSRYIAWQAGDWPTNQRSIGVEQWDFAARMHLAPETHYDRLARLIAYLTETLEIRLEHAKTYGVPGLIYHRVVTPGRRCDPDNCGKSPFDMDQLLDKSLTLRRGGNIAPAPPKTLGKAEIIHFAAAARPGTDVAEAAAQVLRSHGVHDVRVVDGSTGIAAATRRALLGRLGQFPCVIVGKSAMKHVHQDAFKNLYNVETDDPSDFWAMDESDLWDGVGVGTGDAYVRNMKDKVAWRMAEIASRHGLNKTKVLDDYRRLVA